MAKSVITDELFYDLYMIQKQPKKDIIALYPMANVTFRKYVEKAKNMAVQEIDRDEIEKQLKKLFNSCSDRKEKRELLKLMIDMHKVNVKNSNDDISTGKTTSELIQEAMEYAKQLRQQAATTRPNKSNP